MRKKIDWDYHVEKARTSNCTVRSYCKREGISEARFYQERKKRSTPSDRFLPIEIQHPTRRKSKKLDLSLSIDDLGRFTVSGDLFAFANLLQIMGLKQ